MVKEKIVLINVYYSESGYGDRLNFPPVGMGYFSEYLEQKGVEHSVIDMGLGNTISYVIEKVKNINPEFVGISINSLMLNKTHELIKGIKKELPKVKVIVGGPHATTQGIKIFSELPDIDYSIVGEGEESLYELVIGRNMDKIKGLVYRDREGNIRANERRITEELDKLPFPRFSRFKLELYPTRIIPIVSSRGCPFKCIFCQQSSLLSKRWRGVSPEYFIKMLKYWKGRGYNDIHVLDDNFTFDKERLRRIVELYEKEGLSDIKLTLVGGIRISSTTKEVLMLLKRLGVEYISFGVESFSDEVLRFIKKGTTEKQVEEVVKNSCEMGFKVRLFFIIGFPYQTKESLRRVYRFVLRYPVYQVRFFNLIPYENTELMRWIHENGELIYEPSEYMNDFKRYQDIPVFEGKGTMGAEERKEELRIARNFAKLIEERSKYLFDGI